MGSASRGRACPPGARRRCGRSGQEGHGQQPTEEEPKEPGRQAEEHREEDRRARLAQDGPDAPATQCGDGQRGRAKLEDATQQRPGGGREQPTPLAARSAPGSERVHSLRPRCALRARRRAGRPSRVRQSRRSSRRPPFTGFGHGATVAAPPARQSLDWGASCRTLLSDCRRRTLTPATRPSPHACVPPSACRPSRWRRPCGSTPRCASATTTSCCAASCATTSATSSSWREPWPPVSLATWCVYGEDAGAQLPAPRRCA